MCLSSRSAALQAGNTDKTDKCRVTLALNNWPAAEAVACWDWEDTGIIHTNYSCRVKK